MKVYVVLVEPMDTNSRIHNVYARKEQAESVAAELRAFESNAAVSVHPYEVAVPTFTKKLQRANQDGTKKTTVPHYLKPDGEPLEIGDVVTFGILDVEKQGEAE